MSLISTYRALYPELLVKSRHNDIPDSPVARDRLRALIAQARSDLQTCLIGSTTWRQVSRVLELQESLLAPIRTLPSEVLTEIFQAVLETSSKPGIAYSSQESTKLSGRIFLLTWICFWWRDEALSCHTLWSRIMVNDYSKALPTSTVTPFLTECILRSGVSVPLSIEISLLRYENTLPAVITMLVARAHRWTQAALTFSFPPQIDILFPFKPSSTHFPLLEDLSVRSYHYRTTGRVPNPILESHPPLQKLELCDLSESYTDVIKSQNLKILKVGCYSGVSLARLLYIFPCLEFLTLQSFKFEGNSGAYQVTCQSSILTLDIGGDRSNEDKVENGAWTGVTLPTLTKLDVTLPDLIDHHHWEAAYEADTSLSELKEVVKRSKCALQRVNLIMYAEQYERLVQPQLILQTADKFFEGLPVKAEGSFVENESLKKWMEGQRSSSEV
ncbi:hypothetical protein BDP27DRAFT_1326611 [Rhodocollybia butyracea]|uniref:F-box domain-containing protein n=1 Tax=Rhodocollybia butyracea TaxID=206335 RepID=A0A9P5PUJ1_9AGAR|nr:hypothetical protein BDP27DRAFT_1339793 [Rhodocollybia butyracea]KAF9068772.1 hypothetical protein BDP27DRAFT_1326611 [Rhodocollybia butyracea]